MKVQMLSPALANKDIMPDLEKAAIKVLHEGQYILGREVEDFERKCADYLGCKHAITMSSGTDALLCALMALDIGRGDEVICPSFTFFATAGAVSRVGATPVFVDVMPECFTLDPVGIASAITAKTKAIIPVHLFGQSADMESISNIAKQHNLFVIEDVCQAFGSELNGKMLGSIGDIGCFSFFPSKNLGGFGDGGLVTTNNDELASKMTAIRNHGSHQRYYHFMVGANFRLDALQTALLSVKLTNSNMSRMIESRRQHALMYQEGIKGRLALPTEVRGRHTYNQYTIRVESEKVRTELQAHLNAAEIGSAVYYPVPLHKQEAFKDLQSVELPITERLAKEVLSLPISDEITSEQINFVIDTINVFYR